MKGEAQRKRAEARYAEYSRQRDKGLLPADAARDLGVGKATWDRYERSYRQARGEERLSWRGRRFEGNGT